MIRVGHWVSAIVLMAALSLVALVGFWLLESPSLISLNTDPMPVEKHTIQPGEEQVYTFDGCVLVSGEMATVTLLIRTFDSAENIMLLRERVTQVEPGCFAVPVDSVIIPADSFPGRYFVRVINTVKVNPIRTVAEKIVTETFDVQ